MLGSQKKRIDESKKSTASSHAAASRAASGGKGRFLKANCEVQRRPETAQHLFIPSTRVGRKRHISCPLAARKQRRRDAQSPRADRIPCSETVEFFNKPLQNYDQESDVFVFLDRADLRLLSQGAARQQQQH